MCIIYPVHVDPDPFQSPQLLLSGSDYGTDLANRKLRKKKFRKEKSGENVAKQRRSTIINSGFQGDFLMAKKKNTINEKEYRRPKTRKWWKIHLKCETTALDLAMFDGFHLQRPFGWTRRLGWRWFVRLVRIDWLSLCACPCCGASKSQN